MTQKINVGIIGMGFIGPLHIEALRRLGNVEVLAVADATYELAAKAAARQCISRAYGNYMDLISDPDIQVVHICTPNQLHYPIAKAALEYGRHVVCEKPLALTYAQAKSLHSFAASTQLVNAVHFNLRYYPMVHQIKNMIERGEIGEILAVNGSYQQDWLLFDTDYNWRLKKENAGDSRALADIGSHWLDLSEFVTGRRISALCADFSTFYPTRIKRGISVASFVGGQEACGDEMIAIDTEDYASLLLRYGEKARGSLIVSQMAAGRKNRLEIQVCGTQKSVYWDSETPNSLWIGQRDRTNGLLLKDPRLLHPEASGIAAYPGGHNEGFADTSKQLFSKIYSYIAEEGHLKGETPPFPTFFDGVRTLEICDKAVLSNNTRQWVTL